MPSFADLFGHPPATGAAAPGRVNLIGEHTDYHDGFVLPTVVPQQTHVELTRRTDRRVRAWSVNVPGAIVEYETGAEARRGGWIDYVQGVTFALSRQGVVVPGFDLRVASDVPVGAGLSSSAALEIALLRGLRELFGWQFSDLELAPIGRRAETDFVGAPIGIMDQMAASLGRPNEALFLDTRSLAFDRVPVPPSIGLAVLDSGITHAHASGEYATRRRESFEAAARLGVERLRDITLDDLARIERLPEPLNRRARHIVTENARVLDAVAALKTADAIRLGALFNASHGSMRDDYQVSTPEIDLLVAIAQRDPGVVGARLTGGGFGGSIVALVRPDEAAAIGDRVLDRYNRLTGRIGTTHVPPRFA